MGQRGGAHAWTAAITASTDHQGAGQQTRFGAARCSTKTIQVKDSALLSTLYPQSQTKTAPDQKQSFRDRISTSRARLDMTSTV